MSYKCAYCLKPRSTNEGWHDCHQSRDAQERINRSIEGMVRIAEGQSNRPEPVKDDKYLGHAIKGMKAWEKE